MLKLSSLPLAACVLLAGMSLAFAVGGGTGGGTGSGGTGGGGTPGGGSAGGGSSGSGAGNGSGGDRPFVKKTCKKGQVVIMRKKGGRNVATCAKAELDVLPDSELYAQGRELAKAGEYDWALEVLAAIKNQNDPYVLNYTGYSNRKAGRVELGITYYRKALAIDPNFVLAREYLGEGYVAAGRIDLAKVELTEIGNRCGVNCEEYVDLNKAIETAAP